MYISLNGEMVNIFSIRITICIFIISFLILFIFLLKSNYINKNVFKWLKFIIIILFIGSIVYISFPNSINNYGDIELYKQNIKRDRKYVKGDNYIIKSNDILKHINSDIYDSFPKKFPINKQIRTCVFKYNGNRYNIYRIGNLSKKSMNIKLYHKNKRNFIYSYYPLSMGSGNLSNSHLHKYNIIKSRKSLNSYPPVTIYRPAYSSEFMNYFDSPTVTNLSYYVKYIYIVGNESKISTRNAINSYDSENNELYKYRRDHFISIKHNYNKIDEDKAKYLDICNFQVCYYLLVILIATFCVGYIQYLFTKHYLDEERYKNKFTESLINFPHDTIHQIIDGYVFHLIPLLIAVMGGILTIYIKGINDKSYVWLIRSIIPVLSSIQFCRVSNWLYDTIRKIRN